MNVTIVWSYGGKGFDLKNLLLNSRLLARGTDGDLLRFKLPGAKQTGSNPIGPTWDKEDLWRGNFNFGEQLSEVTGTITQISRFAPGDFNFLAGLKLPYQAVAKAMATRSKVDDYAIFKNALKGHDTLAAGSHLGDGRESDKLEGFAGNDKLIGGIGADKLYGGTGADTFVYRSLEDSTVWREGRDTIYDFSARQRDRIDVRQIDADTLLAGGQAFAFIGSEAFHMKAGELRYSTAGKDVVCEGDVDGDALADFAIYVKGTTSLSTEYFLL